MLNTGFTHMTAEEKKTQIKKLIANGDKRSYNEIQADMELQIWSEQHAGTVYNTPSMKPILQRRKEAKSRLEAQLKSGMKPNKLGTTKEKKDNPRLPITAEDKERIQREINHLDAKMVLS